MTDSISVGLYSKGYRAIPKGFVVGSRDLLCSAKIKSHANNMKRCPFCAEEVQDQAVKCKHCQSQLSQVAVSDHPSSEPVKKDGAKNGHSGGIFSPLVEMAKMPAVRFLFWFIYFMAFIPYSTENAVLSLFLLLPPVWMIRTSNDKEKVLHRLKTWRQHKIRVAASVFFVFLAVVGASTRANEEKQSRMIAEYPVPVIEVMSATGDQGDATTYLLQLTATDADTVTVNNASVEPNESGVYEKEIVLAEPSTTLNIKATNEYKNAATSVVVTRNMTEEEAAEEARKEAEAKAEAAQKEAEAAAKRAQEEAEQRAWEQSKAGKICSRHPEWADETCKDIADGNIWIGMEYDMLIEQRGKPSSANPSNYGYGTQWQWCWSWDYDVSCFYDNNDDGIIDSYN